MKKNYNIHINPKPLTKEQIARHKDFDALLQKHYHTHPEKKPFLRKLYYIAGSIAASVAILFFIFYDADRQDYHQKQREYFASQPFINPPLDHVKPTLASYKIRASEGGVYEYPSGSRLVVPAAAFTDNSGQPVSGEVTLFYREMHDFVDFFLSGIPMTYDSAGVQYTLESAGMVEIFAEQDGQRVNMANGKSINVELVSKVNVSPELGVPPGYNIYRLDEETRDWVYQEIDRMEVLEDDLSDTELDENDPLYPAKKEMQEKLQVIQVNQQNEIAALEASVPAPKEPVKPQKVTRNDHVFDLDFNDLKQSNASAELSELYNQYESMLWQISPDETITPAQLQQDFSEVTGIRIQKLNGLNYELVLEKPDQTLTVVVNPVLSGRDYDNALAAFDRDFSRWQQQMAEREAQLKAEREAIAQKYREEARLAELKFEERIADLRFQGLDYVATEEVIRKKVVNRFQVNGFGIWNCDRPLPPDMMRLAASFQDQNGNSYESKTAYLVDKSRNTVYQFLAEDGTPLRFNASSDNLLWLVTPDNKLAVFRPEHFKAISKDEASYTFVLETVDKVIENEEDVREVLYL